LRYMPIPVFAAESNDLHRQYLEEQARRPKLRPPPAPLQAGSVSSVQAPPPPRHHAFQSEHHPHLPEYARPHRSEARGSEARGSAQSLSAPKITSKPVFDDVKSAVASLPKEWVKRNLGNVNSLPPPRRTTPSAPVGRAQAERMDSYLEEEIAQLNRIQNREEQEHCDPRLLRDGHGDESGYKFTHIDMSLYNRDHYMMHCDQCGEEHSGDVACRSFEAEPEPEPEPEPAPQPVYQPAPPEPPRYMPEYGDTGPQLPVRPPAVPLAPPEGIPFHLLQAPEWYRSAYRGDRGRAPDPQPYPQPAPQSQPVPAQAFLYTSPSRRDDLARYNFQNFVSHCPKPSWEPQRFSTRHLAAYGSSKF